MARSLIEAQDDAPEAYGFFSRDLLPEEEILYPEDFDEDGEIIVLPDEAGWLAYDQRRFFETYSVSP